MSTVLGSAARHVEREPLEVVAEPAADAPALPQEQCRSDVEPDTLPRFAHDRWDIRAMRPRNTGTSTLYFSRVNPVWGGALRRAAWSMLHLDDPAEGANNRARRPSGGTLLQIVNFGLAFALWCEERGMGRPSDVTDEAYESFARALDLAGRRRSYVEVNLNALTRLATSGQRVVGEALRTPPWATQGFDAYLSGPRDAGGGENLAEPLAQDVVAPLISWALRFVCDFSDDILEAKTEYHRLQGSMRWGVDEAAEILRDYFQSLRASGGTLPSVQGWRARGGPQLAGQYIAGITGTNPDQVRYYLTREFPDLTLGEPAMLVGDVKGRVGNVGWHPGIAFDDALPLATLLHTAALIVIAYLTGMRPSEVLTLRRGCCSTIVAPNGKRVHAIRGRHYKGVREAGIAAADGAVRDQPWYAIDQVAKAISVVERLHDDDLLWPAKPPWFRAGAATPGEASMRSESVPLRIAEFIEYTRAMSERLGRPQEAVRGAGRIALRQFRRTLAWFIVWQPGGDVAAGLQYGHLEPLTTQGYSGRGRSRDGIGDLVDMERLRRVVDNLADAADRLERGERISGPAAARLVDRVGRFRETFGGRTLTTKQMAALRATTDLRIYESPRQVVTCVMDPERAVCLVGAAKRDQHATPDVTRCSDKCTNRAMTDQHAAELRGQAAVLRQQATSGGVPVPLRTRQEQRAQVLEERAARHDAEATSWEIA